MKCLEMFLIGGLTTAGALTPAAVLAQGATTPSTELSDSESAATIEEVVVTAERRVQNLQKAAISATVLAGEELDKRQVPNVDALVRTTPGFTVNDQGYGKSLNIRGVGSSINASGVQPGVAFYVDGVPMGLDLYQNTPFFDLSRIELLRGPQGTLVGRSSTGGALLIVTQAPVYEKTSGYLEQSFGNYDNLRTRGIANLPLGDRWAFRVAGEYEKRDSFFENLGPSTKEPGNVDRYAVRAALAGKITDDLEVILRSEHLHINGDGPTGKLIPGDPDPTYVPLLAATPASEFQLTRDATSSNDTRYTRTSLDVRWDIADRFQLRSLSAYQYGIVHATFDPDYSSVPTLANDIPIRTPVWTQEFNLISTPGKQLDWVAGVFYMHEYNKPSASFTNAVTGLPVLLIHQYLHTKDVGVFGQTTYHVTDSLNVTAGLRYNREKRNFDRGAFTTPFAGGIPVATLPTIGESLDKAMTGRLTVDYQITPDHFAYATVSRGFKGGGVNAADASTFDPETVWNYETGLKSTFLDGRARTQLAAFHTRNDDLQIYSRDQNLVSTVSNVASGKTWGLEAQVQSRFGNLGVDFTTTWLNTRYDDVALLDARFPSRPAQNVGGFDYNYAPELTANVGVEIDLPVGDVMITPRLQYAYVGSQWAAIYHVEPLDRIEARNLIDATIRATPADAPWQAEFYATNLLDRTYIASKDVINFGTGRVQYYGQPRQYGVRLSYAFD